MSHYFDYDPTLTKNPKTLSFNVKNKEIMVVSDKGTFSKYRVDLGTRIFIDTLITLPIKGDVLDLGSGNGIIGISVKKIFENDVKVSFSDINPYCIELTKEGLKLNNMEGDTYISDGLKSIEKTFDYIFLNSPISAGKAVCYRLYQEAKDKIKENGLLVIVIRKDKGALSHMDYLKTLFNEVEIINKEKGYYIISNKL